MRVASDEPYFGNTAPQNSAADNGSEGEPESIDPVGPFSLIGVCRKQGTGLTRRYKLELGYV